MEDTLGPGDIELMEKLAMAGDRRKALEEDRLKKLGEHHRTVEMRKSQEFLPRSPSAEKLASKMKAANERRREMEEQQHHKFAQRAEYAQEVRKRKATNSSMEMA